MTELAGFLDRASAMTKPLTDSHTLSFDPHLHVPSSISAACITVWRTIAGAGARRTRAPTCIARGAAEDKHRRCSAGRFTSHGQAGATRWRGPRRRGTAVFERSTPSTTFREPTTTLRRSLGCSEAEPRLPHSASSALTLPARPATCASAARADESRRDRGAARQLCARADVLPGELQTLRTIGDKPARRRSRPNRGALLIDFGPNPEEGLREVENALEVSRARRNKDFEAFCLQTSPSITSTSGRMPKPSSYLNQALADRPRAEPRRKGRHGHDQARAVAARSRRLQRGTRSPDAGAAVGRRREHRMEADIQSRTRVRTRLRRLRCCARAVSNVHRAFQGGDSRCCRLPSRPTASSPSNRAAWTKHAPSFSKRQLSGSTTALQVQASKQGPTSVCSMRWPAGLQGRRTVGVSLDHARRLGRVSLEALCRFSCTHRHRRAEVLAALASLEVPSLTRRNRRSARSCGPRCTYWQASRGRPGTVPTDRPGRKQRVAGGAMQRVPAGELPRDSTGGPISQASGLRLFGTRHVRRYC